MKKHELLAPAGDLDAAYAAFHYGADAVYLGLKSFSARASATNFTPEQLSELTAYAHHLNKCVYVTINTLIQEKELDELMRTLDICDTCQVDGIILQDIGVAHIIKENYPNLKLHASTQMAVHNVDGALALKKLGFTRVVLARELTLPEIEQIATIKDLEIEIFVHGALCYAYSGLCQFSSIESGRSANRGKCAYPCRALFQWGEKKAHLFSMKDMALQEHILKLPVCSLKIEGRKKKDLYVAAVVDFYRHILDGKGADKSKAENIKQIFSRPWTTFHLLGKNNDIIDTDFVGHRGLPIGQTEKVFKQYMTFTPKHSFSKYDGLQLDVPGTEKPFGFSVQEIIVNGRKCFEAKAHQKVQVQLPNNAPFIEKGTTIYLASSGQVKATYHYEKPKPNEFKIRYPIDVMVQIETDKITASACGQSVVSNGNFEVAQNSQKANDCILQAFLKYKDTDFKPYIKIENQKGLFVPVSVLNQLRRDLYERIEINEKQTELQNPKPRQKQPTKWLVKTDNLICLNQTDLSAFHEVIVLLTPDTDIGQIKKLPKNKVRLALPSIARNSQNFHKIIKDLLNLGYRKWEIGNPWGLNVLPEKGIDLSFDNAFYTMNSQAIWMAQKMNASRITMPIEDTLENIVCLNDKSPISTVAVVYQDIPLFQSANCIKNNCKHCQKQTCFIPIKKATDSYWAKIKNCALTLISSKPFYMGKLREQVQSDFYRIDFVHQHYTPEQVQDLIRKIQAGEMIPNTQIANLKKNI